MCQGATIEIDNNVNTYVYKEKLPNTFYYLIGITYTF
jgi:hypothetical protein